MLRNPDPARRIAGRLLVVTAIVAALPLTAGRAVNYVDVPATPRPVAAPRATPAVAPLASAAVVTAAQPVAVARPVAPVRAAVPARTRVRSDDNLSISGDLITIDGVTKRWEDLTPAEKTRVRAAVAKANEALSKTHIDQAKILQDLAHVPDQAQIAELQRHLAQTQTEIETSVRRMQARAARVRAAGGDPDHLEQVILEKMQSVRPVDLTAASRALAAVDRQKIAADVANAEASIEKAKAELARLQARMDSDQQR